MKKYGTEFTTEKGLLFFTNEFSGLITSIGSIATWGSPQRRGRRQMLKAPRSVINEEFFSIVQKRLGLEWHVSPSSIGIPLL